MKLFVFTKEESMVNGSELDSFKVFQEQSSMVSLLVDARGGDLQVRHHNIETLKKESSGDYDFHISRDYRISS